MTKVVLIINIIYSFSCTAFTVATDQHRILEALCIIGVRLRSPGVDFSMASHSSAHYGCDFYFLFEFKDRLGQDPSLTHDWGRDRASMHDCSSQ